MAGTWLANLWMGIKRPDQIEVPVEYLDTNSKNKIKAVHGLQKKPTDTSQSKKSEAGLFRYGKMVVRTLKQRKKWGTMSKDLVPDMLTAGCSNSFDFNNLYCWLCALE